MKEQVAVISGSHGFIAQHLSMDLKLKGIKVVPIPRELLYSPSDLQKFFTDKKPDYIFHLAAYGNQFDQKDISMTILANIFGTMNMLQASAAIAYRAFINVSTSSVGLTHETFYSASKAGAERIVKAFVNEFDKPIVNFRPYSVYGEGEADHRFIPTVFRSCITGDAMQLASEGKHDWVYVGDIVHDLIETAQAKKVAKGAVIECGTSIGMANKEIVSLIEKITGKKANITKEMPSRPYDNANWYADYTDSNKVNIQQGLEKTYAYYKEKYQK